MGSPNASKERDRVQAKRSKHEKAESEGKIIQTEFDNSKAQKIVIHSCDESENSSKNYKFIEEEQK